MIGHTRYFGVGLGLMLACAGVAPAATHTTAPPGVLEAVGFDQKLDAQVPLDLTFRDEAGREVRLGDFFGEKPVVLALVYYKCPMLCNMVLNGQLKAMRATKYNAGEEYTALTISFDPSETPELAAAKKANYVDKYKRPGADKAWRFLTGDAANIQALTQAVGFRYTYDEGSQQYAHASGIVVLTPKGRVARYLYGVEYSARDLQFSIMEASQEKIGSPVEQLLLYCFHYDPLTGKYGVVVMNVVRLGGVLTLTALAGFIGVMLYRDRQRRLRGDDGASAPAAAVKSGS
jgi:protein SCO1/2